LKRKDQAELERKRKNRFGGEGEGSKQNAAPHRDNQIKRGSLKKKRIHTKRRKVKKLWRGREPKKEIKKSKKHISKRKTVLKREQNGLKEVKKGKMTGRVASGETCLGRET